MEKQKLKREIKKMSNKQPNLPIYIPYLSIYLYLTTKRKKKDYFYKYDYTYLILVYR